MTDEVLDILATSTTMIVAGPADLHLIRLALGRARSKLLRSFEVSRYVALPDTNISNDM